MLSRQQRIIDEKQALDEKATKLSNFIGNNPIFTTLEPTEQELLKEQCEVMWQYSEILGKRITWSQNHENLLNWAVERWNAEVKHRPEQNVYRRILDDTWRQVIRKCGGDDVKLVGDRNV